MVQRFGIVLAGLSALLLATGPAEARRIVVDEGNFIDLGNNDQPSYDLPFPIDFGTGQTTNFSVVEDFAYGSVNFGPSDFIRIFFEDGEAYADLQPAAGAITFSTYVGWGNRGGGDIGFTDASDVFTPGSFSLFLSCYDLCTGIEFSLGGRSGSVGNALIGSNFLFIAPVRQTAVPEPSSWAMMLIGFGLAGAALRRRRGRAALVPA